MLLTAAKDRAEMTWLEIETATGIRRPTREQWFRASTAKPPLGPIVLLADYLGVSAQDLVRAALADYAAASVTSSDPASRPVAIRDLAAKLSARDVELGSRGQRKPRKPRR